MSSSIAISTAAGSRASASRPALSQLVATHTSQTRSIWRCARNSQGSGDKVERISRRIDKYHRHPEANFRRKAEVRHDWPSTAHRTSSGPGGWALWRSRSSFSDFSAGRERSFWDNEREQMQQRMAHLKKHIAEDPYGAIFGRRLDSFTHLDKNESAWPGFLRSFTTSDHPAKAHLQDFNFAQSPQTVHGGLRYDPISGRMAPAPPQPSGGHAETSMPDTNVVIDCPPGSEVEAKFASNPPVVEDEQFQPAASTASEHYSPLNPQSVDCPPGGEIEALFTSDPTSFKDAQVLAGVPEESAHKPNINIACPPGNELEALLISESVQSSQPQAETFKVRNSTKRLDADGGLNSRRSIECAPGSELEAMFISHPAAREDESRPLDAFEAHPLVKQASVSVDCPPGSEIEAKFASTSLDTPSQSENLRINATSTGEASIDCSPGSEVEAKILADSASRRTEPADATVDCPPGSELEAKFIADPAATEDGPFQPSMVAEPPNAKKANITVDCQPGNELEAMFISDAASAGRGESDDLGALQAKDIRARYAAMSRNLAADMRESRHTQNLDFDGSEDRVGDFLMQSQKIGSPKMEELSAEYCILAYDNSTSEVTTAEAESFFGAHETVQPTEVLARLHNPAKFVPYFAQLQRDGYEIATGGGDILVFRKAGHARKSAVTAEPEVDPKVQSQAAQYLRHDSYPADSFASTSQPPSAPGSQSSSSTNSEPASPKTESSVRKALRRMIFAGTATAASCYAIGVVTEYFRTGSRDGRRIDGFTAFESERRQRE
ncbi:uncharacterized protein N7459_006007 [Penicillium hispanicum]|uniref:uncharacterized protein n=1 Tax=Penicillium hispanicum TaxID=1080232 RepID=UPI0025412480|nr:uncharacterized protein N7459_006007 [Penicillium hispanicum]KAJ5580022.1 hypothetical protein N7459_006007 [Penicillium hispanicum]